MKYIHLGKNYFTIIDAADYDEVSKYTWHLQHKGYAASVISTKPRTQIKLHQFIHGKVTHPLVIDHINRNKLDNRRSNLRAATYSINMSNFGLPEIFPSPSEKERLEAIAQREIITRSRYHNRDFSIKWKRIINITTGAMYCSVREAARITKLRESLIARSARTGMKCGGFNWKYEDELLL